MGNADDWARSLAKQIEAKQQHETERARFTAMSRDIVTEQMPGIWQDLIKAFQEHCKAYNDQVKPQNSLTCHQTGTHDFMVRPDAMGDIVRGHYDYATQRISILTERGTETLTPKPILVGTGKVALVSLSTGRETDLASIVQKALEIGI